MSDTPPPDAVADRALRLLFWLNRRAPALPRLIKHPALGLAWMASSALRRGPLVNAARILGTSSTPAQRTALARRTVASFYDFVCEVGAHQHHRLDQLAARVEVTHGADAYRTARAAGTGAVLVTAHFGNFEVGLAEVRKIEDRVHVVFRRDAMGAFEAARSTLHRNLGIRETPIDDGLTSWLALRDALQSGALDAVATGHAPQSPDAMEHPFDVAAAGTLGLETALGVLLTQTSATLADIARCAATTPAMIAGIDSCQGGPIAPGRPANIAVVDPNESWTVDPMRLASLSRNTAWADANLTGRVRHTICNGEPVVINAEACR